MAVVLGLVDPVLADRRLEGASGLAGLDEADRTGGAQFVSIGRLPQRIWRLLEGRKCSMGNIYTI